VATIINTMTHEMIKTLHDSILDTSVVYVKKTVEDGEGTASVVPSIHACDKGNIPCAPSELVLPCSHIKKHLKIFIINLIKKI
jgi:hypothetical protein